MSNCDRYRERMAGMLDGELTPEETAEQNVHLIRCAACRSDYERLRRAEHKLAAIGFVEVTDEAAAKFWRLPYSRALRNMSVLLIVGGYLALMLYAFVAFLTSGTEGLFQKVSMAAIVIGFVLLLGLLIVERISVWRDDPYKEIER